MPSQRERNAIAGMMYLATSGTRASNKYRRLSNDLLQNRYGNKGMIMGARNVVHHIQRYNRRGANYDYWFPIVMNVMHRRRKAHEARRNVNAYYALHGVLR